MKTAQQWQEELKGETSIESIQKIQQDVLLHAAQVIRGKRYSGSAEAELLLQAAEIGR